MLIGNLELENNVFLAPLAGYTDQAFRMICKRFGVGLMFTEMVSAKALYYKDAKTESLLGISKSEMPVGVQIFGSDPSIMGQVTEDYFNDDERVAVVDINMGCPAPKIVKNGDGSALLRNPKLVYEVVSAVVSASTKPVTVKMRLGIDGELNYLENAKMIELAGASALTVHGRTREMYYSGESDWDAIREIVEHVNIPVIGNGDVDNYQLGLDRIANSGCAGIAIGRGALGNPFIFDEIRKGQKGEEVIRPSIAQLFETIYTHYELICKLKGERVGVREMRKHISHYIKGLRGSSEIKNKINAIDNSEETLIVLRGYEKELDK